ncbi:HET-domain-containing protein [Hypoxylon trugodes]|uniref:HET-domain-containing protein n=1 Tax=Hypoxylon trugodes TaxID=326681 RepID=UPI0021A1D374|nr:HET-domain-containing protein [Hypoxylon trugodes]KAI1382814.1 HET-domain-containing protein [Hypoxylon trugodes]
MLCNICKDSLESIGKFTQNCLYKLHTKKTSDTSNSSGNTRPLKDCWCVYDNHRYGHHRDEDSFIRSAQQGCVMCSDFPFYDDQTRQSIGFKDFGFFSTFKFSFDRDIIPCMTVDTSRGSKTIELVPAKLLSGGLLNFNLSGSTNSAQTWSIISYWIRMCSQFHDRCKLKAGNNAYKPTRLLEINYSKDSYSSELPTFRLVNGEDCPQGSSYATLSYRWGDKPLERTIRLLKHTFTWLEMPNTINFNLPKTIQDAMYITHRLGIQYLWIDRLCIYQDSMEDWHREAGTVQDVYRNASFCISALSAEDDEGGCFFDRDPSLVAPTPIRLHGERRSYRAELEDMAWSTAFHNEPLLQRGWVLQERLMSPRTIYFGRKQVYWECAECHACETHPRGFGKFAPSDEPRKKQDDADFWLWKQLIAIPALPHTTTDPQARILANWSATMSLYSNTKLTVSADKLVAVSGLAKDVRRALKDVNLGRHRYLAGLWEEVLMQTLVWYVRVGSPAHRPTRHRAPSWSWASLDGHLIIPDTFLEDTTELSTLLSADMEFLSKDDTREVKSATLTLYGPTCLVTTQASSYNQYAARSFRRLDSNFSIECNGADDSWLSKPTVIFDTIDDFRNELVCIWLVAQPASLAGWQASGLALQCVGLNMYRRLGTVSCYHSTQARLEQFVDIFPRTEVKII